MLFAIILVLSASSIYSVYAESKIDREIAFENQVLDLDNSLTPPISATLTGLSLTGASFLVNIARSSNEDSDAAHIRLARKFFIKAFFMFLICTIALFIFDFIQILSHLDPVLITLVDIIITFALFSIGVVYLSRAARELYITYGR
jgi:uncharacterized membrane protein